jgi:uncharacterized membrane protein YeaQ/YmgE (transglycosylase-associated protein family)
MFLALLCWLVIGFLTAVVAGKFVNVRNDDPRLGLVVGACAAAAGGFIFRLFSAASTGPGLWSLMVAAATAVLALVVWHMVRSASRA